MTNKAIYRSKAPSRRFWWKKGGFYPGIKQEAIDRFLNRQLRSYNWLKGFSDRDLDWIIKNEVKPRPKFVTKLRTHQKAAFIVGSAEPVWYFSLDMGTGKTKIALDLIRYREQADKVRRTLIVVEYRVQISEWISQMKQHAPDLKARPHKGDRERLSEFREAVEAQDRGVFICTYAGLSRMCSMKVKTNKDRNKLMLDVKELSRIGRLFDMIVLDEATAIKNHNSLIFKVSNHLADNIPYRIEMSGTPCGRNPADIWSQFYFLDRGETLGRTLGLFRAAFFNAEANHWGGVEYTFKKAMRPALHKMIKNRSLRYAAHECLDLPAKTYLLRRASFPEETDIYNTKMLVELRKLQKAQNTKKAELIFAKLRQAASGFMYYTGDDKQRTAMRFPDNPKTEMLEAVLSDIDIKDKLLVFHDFIETGDIIENVFKTRKVGYVRVKSGQRDTSAVLERFKSDPTCRGMILSYHVGAKGLNLQSANYTVFFESTVSPLLRQQAERRTWRDGQRKKVFYIDFEIRKSVEPRIRRLVKEGEDTMRAIMDGRVTV